MKSKILHAFGIKLAVTVIAVAVIGAVVFYFSSKQSSEATLAVKPTDFVEQVSVSGKVVAAENVDLGFNQNGRVAAVNAQVGDRVSAGAVIASIENGDLRAALLQKEQALKSQQAKLDSLKAGTRPEEIAVSQSNVLSARTALEQANQGVVNAIQNAYTQSDDAIHNKMDQFITNPRSINPQLGFSITDSQLQINILSERVKLEDVLNKWEAHLASLLATGDFSSYIEEAQTNLNLTARLLSEANTALNMQLSTGSPNATAISGYITSVATGRSNINTAISSLTSAVTAQTADAAALATAESSLKLAEAGATAADIDAQTAQVNAAAADVLNAQALLDKTIIRAPFAGIITRMDAKAGEIVSPQTSDISMIGTGIFEIETYIPEVNIASVKVGNEAAVTLDAYGPNVQFDAKVISIDPAETIRDGVSTYKTKLQFASADSRIKSGMTASVVITTAKVANAYVIPQGAIFEKNGKKVVQVLRAGEAIDVPVVVGSISQIGNARILEGLSDGDIVVLNPNITR